MLIFVINSYKYYLLRKQSQIDNNCIICYLKYVPPLVEPDSCGFDIVAGSQTAGEDLLDLPLRVAIRRAVPPVVGICWGAECKSLFFVTASASRPSSKSSSLFCDVPATCGSDWPLSDVTPTIK